MRRQAFVLKKFRKPRFDFIWHVHPEFELTFIRRGYGVRYVHAAIDSFAEGDLCLLAGNLPHAYASQSDRPSTCQWTVVHFMPDAWGDRFWALPENGAIASLLKESASGLFFPRLDHECLERMDKLESLSPRDGRRLPVFLEILHLLAMSARTRINAGASPESGGRDPRIGRVLAWLEEHASGDVRQIDAARLAGMTTPAFSRFFHRATGRTFSDHLNQIRIARGPAAPCPERAGPLPKSPLNPVLAAWPILTGDF